MSELSPISTAIKPGDRPISGFDARGREHMAALRYSARGRVDSMETDAVRTARPVEGDDTRHVELPIANVTSLTDTGESAPSELADFPGKSAAADVSAA